MTRILDDDRAVCRGLLPAVSRTFALTIRVLPPELRQPVTVAYLLCRIADIIEDATGEDPTLRVKILEGFAGALAESGGDVAVLDASLAPADRLRLADAAGAKLLRDRIPVIRAYAALEEPVRSVVSRWVQAMALGMSTFIAREMRSTGSGNKVLHFLETEEELRSYAYYVAGTVGHLLTELFALHLHGWRHEGRGRDLAVPFGLGLQFTNILQDMAEDRRRGWSYVPDNMARRHGTTAWELDDPAHRRAGLRVVGELVTEAAGYLDQAMEYTLLLPRRAPRLRLFCLWPVFFALRTLVRVWGEERILAGGEKIRISRGEVRRVIGATMAVCLSDGALDHLYQRERRRLQRRIALNPI